MTALERLDLSHNSLTTIRKLSLSGAVNFRELFLNDNVISIIHQGAFALPSLIELGLDKNRLVTLLPKLFVGLHFEILRLSWNPMQQPEHEPIEMPEGIEHLQIVPHGKIDIQWYAQYADLGVLQVGECHTNDVIWPRYHMPQIHTLELIPIHGFKNGNEILENLNLFPNVKIVSLHIRGFRGKITIDNLRQHVSSIEKLNINGKVISELSSLKENGFLRSLIYNE